MDVTMTENGVLGVEQYSKSIFTNSCYPEGNYGKNFYPNEQLKSMRDIKSKSIGELSTITKSGKLKDLLIRQKSKSKNWFNSSSITFSGELRTRRNLAHWSIMQNCVRIA